MGSLGGETAKKKAMWLYPKVLGFNPSERWGHSACYSHGIVYVFGVRIISFNYMNYNSFFALKNYPLYCLDVLDEAVFVSYTLILLLSFAFHFCWFMSHNAENKFFLLSVQLYIYIYILCVLLWSIFGNEDINFFQVV